MRAGGDKVHSLERAAYRTAWGRTGSWRRKGGETRVLLEIRIDTQGGCLGQNLARLALEGVEEGCVPERSPKELVYVIPRRPRLKRLHKAVRRVVKWGAKNTIFRTSRTFDLEAVSTGFIGSKGRPPPRPKQK